MSDRPADNVPKNTTPPTRRSWLEHPHTGKRILTVLCVTCAGLFLADLAYHKHAHFEFEQSVGFHGLFGFFAYLTIVNSAKLLRHVVKRPEDYYNE